MRVSSIRAGVWDSCWSPGALVSHAQRDSVHAAQLMVCLTTLWGLRLSVYLAWRNWGHGEDRRYQAMREKHGSRFWLVSLGTVFMLQAVLLWFISWPVQMAILSRGRFNVLDYVGAVLWLVWDRLRVRRRFSTCTVQARSCEQRSRARYRACGATHGTPITSATSVSGGGSI